MYFDTHAHLGDARFDPDRAEVLARGLARGVTRIVEVADAPADWERSIGLCRANPDLLRCALGLHPYHAPEWSPELEGRLARSPEVVAVGEVGLDYAKCAVPRAIQEEALLKMLALAGRLRLPVVLHCRDAYADLLHLLAGFYGGRPPEGRYRGVLHCFSGNAEEALAAVRLGFALGADGPVTYPKNDALRAALQGAGLDALVLETDSPYLPPQSRRGERNEPGLLPEIAAKVAVLFDVPVSEAARRTSANARDLFRWEYQK